MRRSIYLEGLLAMLGLVFLAAASAAPNDGSGTPAPPTCPANSKEKALFAGTTPDGQAPLYIRWCGRARLTAQFGDQTIRVRGFCDPRPTIPTNDPTRAFYWLQGGLLTNGPPVGRAVGLVLAGPNSVPAGVARVVDGEVQIPGIAAALDGISVVGKGWQRGYFWVRARGATPDSANGVTITGSWTCR
jgi:hypothetical protein